MKTAKKAWTHHLSLKLPNKCSCLSLLMDTRQLLVRIAEQRTLHKS